MLTKNDWKGVLIRYIKSELAVLDAFCKKNKVKRSDAIRNATRLYVNYPDLINGVIKVKDANIDIAPVIKHVDAVAQKIDQIGKKVNSLSSKDDFKDLAIKRRITHAILAIKHRTKKRVIAVEQLREELKTLDLSFAPYLYATNSSGICVLDECLFKLEQKKELLRKSYSGTGIIEWRREKCSGAEK